MRQALFIRGALLTIGALLALLGMVWILQGLKILGGSAMSGQAFWAWAGLLTLVVGLGLLYLGTRKGAHKDTA